MRDAHELKALQVRCNALEKDIADHEYDRDRLSKRLSELKNELNVVRQKIEKIGKSAPVVTEHALLRYIERVMGVDLDQIANAILTEQNKKAIEFAPSCRIKSNGVEFVVKDRTVVSVVA